MLTPEQACLLGEFRVRRLWPRLSPRDKYVNLLQIKYRSEMASFELALKVAAETLWAAPGDS